MPPHSVTLRSNDSIAIGRRGIYKYPILPTEVTHAIIDDRFSNGTISPIYGKKHDEGPARLIKSFVIISGLNE